MEQVQPIPKWLSRRYAKLWNKFRDDEFSFDEAVGVLGDDSRVVSLCLSDLNKFGWISRIRPNPDDSRKKLYTMTPVEKVFTMMASIKQKVG